MCAVPAVEEEKAEDDRGGDGSEVEVGGGDGVDPVDEGCDDGGHLSGMALAFSSEQIIQVSSCRSNDDG